MSGNLCCNEGAVFQIQYLHECLCDVFTTDRLIALLLTPDAIISDDGAKWKCFRLWKGFMFHFAEIILSTLLVKTPSFSSRNVSIKK